MKKENAIFRLQSIDNYLKRQNDYSERNHDAIMMAIEALKTETKKCPICGSDLYEYCFMCCYEGKKVKRNDDLQE